ncbi:hypothetical protein OTK49_28350 [Vibrio coralliirubri]|uniref:hypothetical protein n=1 Tax=Vibrio coralliirubri TaxID=1516159 RepID=UPI0022851A01|nr:hypothetical protein [Vibrio coralliirubri]MCY9866455.1 hypothetical protein [Vibrio coralliirubri]
MGEAVLEFKETTDFFDRLDQNVKLGHSVTIRFIGEKPEQNSKLWKRLRKAKNWECLNLEFEKAANHQPTPMTSIASSTMVSRLTGGEILLIAWISTLLTGLFTYAIYKGRTVRLKANDKDGNGGELIIA